MANLESGIQIAGGIHQILEVANRYYSRIDNNQAATSLVEMSQLVRVEPNCLIDASLRSSEVMYDVQQNILSLFSGFYLQAVTIGLSNGDLKTKVEEKLESFGTRAPKIKSLFESSIGGLQTAINDYSKLSTAYVNVKQGAGFESYKDYQNAINKSRYNPFTGEYRVYKQNSQEGISQEAESELVGSLKEIKDDSKLTVGKLIVIDITSDQQKASLKVPVAIRLMTGYLKSPDLVQLLSFGSKDITALDREIGYKTGRLSFWKDIVLCNDLYTQFRKNLMKDKTGYFKSTLDKQNASVKNHILTGGKYSAAISSVTVLSSTTAKALEENLTIKLGNFQQRNKLMQTTGMMILAIVDENYRMVEIYLHSVEKSIQASFSDLKKASNKDNSVADIMTALTMGNAPRL